MTMMLKFIGLFISQAITGAFQVVICIEAIYNENCI